MKLTAQEVVELIKLLGHIRARSGEYIAQLDVASGIRTRLFQSVENTSEALREVLEEVKEHVR